MQTVCTFAVLVYEPCYQRIMPRAAMIAVASPPTAPMISRLCPKPNRHSPHAALVAVVPLLARRAPGSLESTTGKEIRDSASTPCASCTASAPGSKGVCKKRCATSACTTSLHAERQQTGKGSALPCCLPLALPARPSLPCPPDEFVGDGHGLPATQPGQGDEGPAGEGAAAQDLRGAAVQGRGGDNVSMEAALGVAV